MEKIKHKKHTKTYSQKTSFFIVFIYRVLRLEKSININLICLFTLYCVCLRVLKIFSIFFLNFLLQFFVIDFYDQVNCTLNVHACN